MSQVILDIPRVVSDIFENKFTKIGYIEKYSIISALRIENQHTSHTFEQLGILKLSQVLHLEKPSME